MLRLDIRAQERPITLIQNDQSIANRNFLLVTARAPWPTDSGGQQRTYLLAEAIRRIGNLHTLLIDPKPQPTRADIEIMTKRFGLVENGIFRSQPKTKWRRYLFPGHTEFGYDKGLSEKIRSVAQALNCNFVLFRYLPLAARSTTATNDGIVRLVDIDDVPSLRSESEYKLETGLRRVGKHWIANRIGLAQREAISRTNGGWVSCDDDLQIVRDERFTVLPNIPIDALEGPATQDLCQQAVDSRSILFVGALRYAINVDAVRWFIEKVLPIVVQKLPEATFRIAGGGLDDIQKEKFGSVPGVELLGYVDNLTAEYKRCALTVVPIRAGAGTKIKVLESLRYGRPVVLTSHSLRGYDGILKDGEDLLVADDPHAMALAITTLLRSPVARERLACNGQTVVNSQFGFERFLSIVSEHLIPSIHSG